MTARSGTRVDVVIAGAGIAGIATAWQLAERLGRTTTLIVDPLAPLSLTSDRPEANYRDWWPQPAMVRLADRSIALMEGLLGDGASFAMDRRGYLYVTTDEGTATGLADVAERHLAAGHAVLPQAGRADVLSEPGRLQARYPYLAAEVRGAILARRAGGIDAVDLGRALLDRATARGVRVVRGEVTDVAISAGRVSGVTLATADGPFLVATERFVDAAGPYVRPLARFVGTDLDVETVLRQKVVIRDPRGVIPRDAPFTISLDPQVLDWSDDERRRLEGSADTRPLLEPLPSGVHVKPDDPAGPDAIKLGWAWDQASVPPTRRPACPPEFPRMVVLAAATFIPGLRPYLDANDGLDLVAHEGGFYARTRDGRPLIGPLAVDGSFVVGALAGFGAMMACAAGELAAGLILGEDVGAGSSALAMVRAFDAQRSFEGSAGSTTARTGEL